MARALSSDFFQGYAFHVREPNNYLAVGAGFQNVDVPEVTVNAVEYREGTYTYTRKQPGIPTQGELSLRRGVTRASSDFYNWILNVIEGRDYRTDLEIYHYHRVDEGFQQTDGTPSRIYRALECFPTRYKPAETLEATSEDISVEDLGLAYEELVLVRQGSDGDPTPSTGSF